ncbi:MAG: aldose 1-epimerase [Caulobacterales bacterium]|nr:aldose 1-epimerase [Caulobacterales bacterium]
MIRLVAADLELVLAPELGGSVLTLRKAGIDLLRPTPAGADDVLETACFPLVPYANRIREGRFELGGRTARLAPNLPGERHPLHGDGWRGAWRVEAQGEASAELAFEPAAGGWPWPYRARQRFRLDADALEITLAVTNASDAAGPFGLGFHPYFPHAAEAWLTATTDGVWLTDAEVLPERWVPGQPLGAWAQGAPARGPALVDHCHTGWRGPARIDLGPGRPSLRLSASPELAWLQVYAPPDQDFFCVEPVSHAPDAVNMADPAAHGLRWLQPGETWAVSMWLELWER